MRLSAGCCDPVPSVSCDPAAAASAQGVCAGVLSENLRGFMEVDLLLHSPWICYFKVGVQYKGIYAVRKETQLWLVLV